MTVPPVQLQDLDLKKCRACGAHLVSCVRVEPHYIPFVYHQSKNAMNPNRDYTSVGVETVAARCRSCGTVGDETGWRVDNPYWNWTCDDVPMLVEIPKPNDGVLRCVCGGVVVLRSEYSGYYTFTVNADGTLNERGQIGIVEQPGDTGDLVCEKCGRGNLMTGHIVTHIDSHRVTVKTAEQFIADMRYIDSVKAADLEKLVKLISTHPNRLYEDVREPAKDPEACPQCGWPACAGDQAYCPACSMDGEDTSW